MRTIAIIQARMGSTRLPDKVMIDLAGKPMLDRVVTRVKRANLDGVMVATTTDRRDDIIIDYCRKHYWGYSRGDEQDVLDRYHQAALLYEADIIVRITADCPLIDPGIIDKCVDKFKSLYPNIDYVSNLLPRTFPKGLDVEVISFEALKKEWETATLWREHITLNIRNNPHLYRVENVSNDIDYSSMRWTVDLEEDLAFPRKVYSLFRDEPFGFKDILDKVLNTYLRPITEEDYPITMAWRSNPLVYEGFYQQDKPLEWKEHINWYRTRNKDWRCFIVMYKDRPVGIVILQQLDHWEPEIGFYIGEVSLWGKGIGKAAVQMGLNHLRKNGYRYCHTTILEGNVRSIGLLKALGFEGVRKAREGEIWMTLKL